MEKRGVNASVLKNIALVSMLIDHIAAVLFLMGDANVFVSGNPVYINIYLAARAIGRIAFPIFAFLLVEGFIHTSNWNKYILRMLVFALISQISYNLAFGDAIIYPDNILPSFIFGNVLWLFTIGLVMLRLLEKVSTSEISKLARLGLTIGIVLVFFVLGDLLMLDRRGFGIVTIAVFYIFRSSRIKQILAGAVALIPQQSKLSYLVLPLIYFYNGIRGKNTPNTFFMYFIQPTYLSCT